MYNLNYIYRDLDPDYIQKLPTEKKDKYRKRLIVKFLLKTYYNNLNKIKEQKDKLLVKNTKDYLLFCLFWTFPLSLVTHFLLFRGVYELRSFYFNPKTVSIMIKYPISLTLSAFLLVRYWYNYVYMPEVYELIFKY